MDNSLITSLSNIIGLLGVFITLAAYFLLNIGKISYITYSYSIMNAAGSLMILFSLLYAWNLAAFMMEISWLLISLYGCFKAHQIRRKH